MDEFLSIPTEDCGNNNDSCSPGFFLGEADEKKISFSGDSLQVLVIKSDKDSIVLNDEESSKLVVVEQDSSCQVEKDSSKFEEIGIKGGLIDKKVEENSKSFGDSISSSQNEPIALDRKGSNYSNTMNIRSMGHVDEFPSTSSAYLLGMRDEDLCSSGTEYLNKMGSVYEIKYEILRNAQFRSNHHGISSQMRDASGKKQISYDEEELAHHSRCMYKRLQFEDVEKHTGNFMNLKSPCFIPETTMIASNIETSHASTTNIITMCDRIQTFQSLSENISCNYLVKTDSSEQSKGRLTAVASGSSGIGLHLNAIGMDMKMPEVLGIEGKTLVDYSCEIPSQGLKNMMVSRNEGGGVPVQLISNSDDSSFDSMGECNMESHQKSLDSAPDYLSPLGMEPLDKSVRPEFSDHHITPCSRKRQPCVKASKSEDSAQSSLGKKRKKDPDIEGQKRCNCKRSKCLKLYCDCFAAGMFCNKGCACQGCSNNSENEEMVCSTRQLIEARNPLAFAPKVVHANGDLKEIADNKHITPPSSRHKRGCNCKKSKCLKKYCECYQAGVGCSFGCRCEGCKNIYGTKEAYGDITEMVVEHQKPEDGLNGNSSVEALEISNKEYNTKQIHTRFTLPTPLSQRSNVNGIAGLQLPASFQPSSDPNYATLSLESPNPTLNRTRNSSNGGRSEETSSIITPYNQQFDSSSGLNVDSPSPGWNGFPDICNISPLSGPSPTTLRTEHTKSYYARLMISGRDTSPGASFQHSLNVTTQAILGEGKFIEPHYNLVDESPEILMDDVHSPIVTVKASSPNQKRISPTKKMLLEGGSSFSPGLKSGRKYFLHSIPQFPSLTPYRNNSKNKGSPSPSLE